MILVTVALVLGLAGKDSAFVREDIMMLRLFQTYPMHLARIFTDGWAGLYGNDFPWIDWSYRPLEMMVDWTVINLFGESETLQILFKSAVIGLCAALIYLVALELTRKSLIAVASSLFSALSIPVIIEGWWFHHIIGYAEAIILLGFFSYLRYIRLPKLRWLIVFWACSLAAPLLGEYGISLPLTVLLSSAIDSVITRKANWKVQVSYLILVILAVFPAFLPNLLIAHRIVLTSVFGTFFPKSALAQGVFSQVFHGSAYYLVLSALSPMLSLMAFASLVRYYWINRNRCPNLILMGFVLLCLLAIVFVKNYPRPSKPELDLGLQPADFFYVLPALFPLGLAILSYPMNRFLSVWFVISYVPFVRLAGLPVNLIPALIPWTMLSFLWIFHLTEALNLRSIGSVVRKRGITWNLAGAVLVVIVLVIGIAAQISNVALAKEIWQRPAVEVREMGKSASGIMPAGSVILGEQDSLFEALDMSYYSGGKATGNVASFDSPVWFPVKAVTPQQLYPFLSGQAAYAEKYFLMQDNLFQTLYRYWQESPEQFKPVYRLDIKSRVLLIDPLYLVLPQDIPRLLGFYIRREQNSGNSPFRAEFSGGYTLYRYVGE
jgi:hypothetical protein